MLWPWLTVTPTTHVPPRIAKGDRIALHLRFLGLLPGWTHQIAIERLTPEEIVSHEHGGPIRVWNHCPTFVPTSPASCRYTDAVEIRAVGPLTPLAAAFAAVMYRYRQARWRALARVLA